MTATIEQEEVMYRIVAGGETFGAMRKIDTWNGFDHYKGLQGECFVVGDKGGMLEFMSFVLSAPKEGEIIMASGDILKALKGDDDA